MIKDNQRRLNRVHVLLDALITILAYALAWFVVISGNVMDTPGGTLPPQETVPRPGAGERYASHHQTRQEEWI